MFFIDSGNSKIYSSLRMASLVQARPKQGLQQGFHFDLDFGFHEVPPPLDWELLEVQGGSHGLLSDGFRYWASFEVPATPWLLFP